MKGDLPFLQLPREWEWRTLRLVIHSPSLSTAQTLMTQSFDRRYELASQHPKHIDLLVLSLVCASPSTNDDRLKLDGYLV